MYEPNAFGLYDTLGNIAEYVRDCMKTGYTGAPVDGSAVTDPTYETRITRGGSWHWEGLGAHSRVGLRADFVGTLEGFRVALDIDGAPEKGSTSTPSASAWELAAEQQKERDKRSKRAEIPAS